MSGFSHPSLRVVELRAGCTKISEVQSPRGSKPCSPKFEGVKIPKSIAVQGGRIRLDQSPIWFTMENGIYTVFYYSGISRIMVQYGKWSPYTRILFYNSHSPYRQGSRLHDGAWRCPCAAASMIAAPCASSESLSITSRSTQFAARP